ncbi:MAG: Ala-tRNA(Pro) deacylase [Actinomycetota bacterium]|nr:Ala-tRNA(Pro) deacylase [Actinomycetota bacterium]
MSAIIEYLQGKGVAFTVLPSPQSDSALDTIQAHGVPAAELARTVVMTYRFGFALMVIPTEAELDLHLAQIAMDDPEAREASLREIAAHFEKLDAACIPPLGLYFLAPMWVDPEIAHRDQIAFAAGRPSLVIRMSRSDLFRDDPFVITPLTVPSAEAEAVDTPPVTAEIA